MKSINFACDEVVLRIQREAFLGGLGGGTRMGCLVCHIDAVGVLLSCGHIPINPGRNTYLPTLISRVALRPGREQAQRTICGGAEMKVTQDQTATGRLENSRELFTESTISC